MEDKRDFVCVKLDIPRQNKDLKVQKAMQIRLDQNKTVVVYNRINNYILEALFSHDDA